MLAGPSVVETKYGESLYADAERSGGGGAEGCPIAAQRGRRGSYRIVFLVGDGVVHALFERLTAESDGDAGFDNLACKDLVRDFRNLCLREVCIDGESPRERARV